MNPPRSKATCDTPAALALSATSLPTAVDAVAVPGMPRGPDRSLQRRGRGQGPPRDVVDHLGHHVTVGTEDGEPGTLPACR